MPDPIKHIIVLMLENRSFDQVFGAFQSVYSQLDGINPEMPYRNADLDGQVFEQLPNATRTMKRDPPHGLDSVLRQINAPIAKKGPDTRGNDFVRGFSSLTGISPSLVWKIVKGVREHEEAVSKPQPAAAAGYQGAFVREFHECYPDSLEEDRQQIMSYFDVGSLPALHDLANNFTICDRWFSSLPGPTWANRIFFHTGTAYGISTMPERHADIRAFSIFDQETIYDRLSEKGRKWRIYFHDYPQSLVLTRLWGYKAGFSPISQFEHDASGPECDFPEFVFIEPNYNGTNQNDDHPPHDSMLAQRLIARIYNGIRKNEELWNSSLLIVTYDEHGGFFDHVEPPAAVAPDNFLLEYTFDQLGVRVPAVLVSPWVERGVFSETLDHTCVGKYLCDKWNLLPLGRRMAHSGSFASVICRDTPRQDTPSTLSVNAQIIYGSDGVGAVDKNENQLALEALANALDPGEHIPAGFSGDERGQDSTSYEDDMDGLGDLKSKALRFLRS